jgi:hypothetical protein
MIMIKMVGNMLSTPYVHLSYYPIISAVPKSLTHRLHLDKKVLPKSQLLKQRISLKGSSE